ncbi:hypothetical protein HPT25_23680 [Bacillus sp. BRMEA1]|uniref:hypothetical protein n=1 Tax=Neobacillus endophyticus TaxID=2738405 RepID=UPI001562EB96|nr:hypothetical protein [Neobacillus endophyticus]NRD80327.1 hypothetical protein [Neobacillus endophyticus]
MTKEQQIRSLSCHQIVSLINKGKWVYELKAEWLKRWGMEFPYYKDINGIKEM